MSKSLTRIHGWLRRHSLLMVVALGVTLYLPSLDVGFVGDDLYQLAVLDGVDDGMGPIQGQVYPWWVASDFRKDLLRPLADAVFRLDHLLYARGPFGFHVSSLVLWGLLLLVVMIFFRSLESDPRKPSAVLLLAGIFFAFDEAHVLNISWIAYRYSILGALFSVAALWQYHLYRGRDRRRSLWLALFFIWLAFLSAEGSLATVVWIAAYELVLGTGKPAGRVLRVTPFVCSAAVYILAYTATGHANAGSDCFLNQLMQPLALFWQVVTVRLPCLITGALTPVPAEMSFPHVGTGVHWSLAAAWILAGATVVLLVFHVSRREQAQARMMFLGGLISLLPGAAAHPHNFMLLLPTVGLAWVLASYVVDAWRRFRKGLPRGRLALGAAAIFVLVHGILAPAHAVIVTELFRNKSHQALAAAMNSELPGPGEADRARVLLLSTGESSYFIPLLRWAAGLPFPAAVWVVTMGKGEYLFNQTGSNSFGVIVREGDLLANLSAHTCRKDFHLREGERFLQGAMRVTIRKVIGEKVKEFLVAIDLPLDDPKVWLMVWDGKRFVRVPRLPWKYPWRHGRR